RCWPRSSDVSTARRCHRGRVGGTRQRNRVRRRLSTRPHPAHRAREPIQKERASPLLCGVHVPADGTFRKRRSDTGNRKGRIYPQSAIRYPLLSEGDELPASSQVVCSATSQLSRPPVAAGGVWDGLSLREERRVIRVNAGALAANERRPYLLHARAIRSRVQCRQRNVSQIFQTFRDREISDAFLDA